MYTRLINSVRAPDLPADYHIQRDSYLICDRNGRILYHSSGMQDLLQSPAKLPTDITELLDQETPEGRQALQSWQSGGSFPVTIKSKHEEQKSRMQVTVLDEEPPVFHVRFRPEGVSELPGNPFQIKDNEILDAISAQIAVLDKDGIVRAVNDSWVKFARENGAPPGESYVGYNYLDVCRQASGASAEEADSAAQGLQAILEGKKNQFDLEYPCHSPDERRWFVMRANAIPGESGGAVIAHINITSQKLIQRMMQSLNRDLESRVSERTEDLEAEIAVRKLAEEEAQSGRQRLEALLATVPDYVWSFRVRPDSISEMELQSPAVERITGYSAAYFAREPSKWMEMIIPDDRPEVEEALNSIVQGLDERVELDFRIRNRKGETRWLNSHFVVMSRDMAGCRIAGVTSDITERRRMENALAEKNDFVEKAASSLPGLLFVRDMHENRFSYLSKQLLPLYDGLAAYELTPFGTRVHPEDVPLVKSRRQDLESLPDGEVQDFQYRVRIGDGKWIWLRSRCMVFARAGQSISHMLGYVEDITSAKAHLDDMEEARQEVHRAMMARDRFLANISHEIRTPIFAILGMSEILLKKGLDQESQKYLSIVKNSGDTLLQLLNDIIEFSRLESGHIQLESIPVRIKEELQQILEPYRYRAVEKGLVFEFRISEKVPDVIISDPLRLKQIVTNLVSNAVKFTETGRVEVHMDVLESDAIPSYPDKRDLMLSIAVSDTGIGIPEEHRDHVFQVFKQSDDSINRRFGGSGLGLSIVQELVDLMRGKLEMRSPSELIRGENPGTDFQILIPVKKTSEEEDGSAARAPQTLWFESPRRVMVVEDNPINQMLLEKFLTDMNCQVVTLENGLEAVRHLDADRGFDVILMDVNMPEMDGYQATRRIRDAEITVPVIGVTADVFKEDVDRCMEAGMNDHLGKPIWPEDLYEKLALWTKAGG